MSAPDSFSRDKTRISKPDSQLDPSLPTQIGAYKVKGTIGSGGMGTVVLLAVFALLACACGNTRRALSVTSLADNPLHFLEIGCEVGSATRHSGNMVLRIRNPAESTVDGVEVTLNKAYSAQLAELRVYRGFVDGSPPLGRSTILAGETLEFVFSHDITNYNRMHDDQGRAMPNSIALTQIELTSALGRGAWSVH
jgi:hypothetical protein